MYFTKKNIGLISKCKSRECRGIRRGHQTEPVAMYLNEERQG
jgi:hypothetical protein